MGVPAVFVSDMKIMQEVEFKQIENAQYTDEVKYAVRYGWQYRKEAEEHADRNAKLHYSLAEATTILYWLANLVITGVAYDLIKKYAMAFWDKLMSMKTTIPEDVNTLLIDEDELKKFVVYVKEFSSKEMSATDEQTKYIREEIIADYIGKTAGEIWTDKKRLPSHEEWLKMYQDANAFADELLEN